MSPQPNQADGNQILNAAFFVNFVLIRLPFHQLTEAIADRQGLGSRGRSTGWQSWGDALRG
ncbi:MAG: hypothetical protein GY850_45170 [bacterium]|nr:hypothetical protein [bacterium]